MLLFFYCYRISERLFSQAGARCLMLLLSLIVASKEVRLQDYFWQELLQTSFLLLITVDLVLENPVAFSCKLDPQIRTSTKHKNRSNPSLKGE